LFVCVCVCVCVLSPLKIIFRSICTTRINRNRILPSKTRTTICLFCLSTSSHSFHHSFQWKKTKRGLEHTYTHTHTYIHTYTYNTHTYTYTHTHKHTVNTYTCIEKYDIVKQSVCCMCMYVCMCVCVCMCVLDLSLFSFTERNDESYGWMY